MVVKEFIDALYTTCKHELYIIVYWGDGSKCTEGYVNNPDFDKCHGCIEKVEIVNHAMLCITKIWLK